MGDCYVIGVLSKLKYIIIELSDKTSDFKGDTKWRINNIKR